MTLLPITFDIPSSVQLDQVLACPQLLTVDYEWTPRTISSCFVDKFYRKLKTELKTVFCKSSCQRSKVIWREKKLSKRIIKEKITWPKFQSVKNQVIQNLKDHSWEFLLMNTQKLFKPFMVTVYYITHLKILADTLFFQKFQPIACSPT